MMPRITVVFIIHLFLFSSIGTVIAGNSENEDGQYPIRYYSRKEYSAATQNWAIVQDRRGIMYFGNNEGILEYDGVSWRKIITANGTGVRSLAIDSGGTVYAGAQNEFGFLQADSSGTLKYVSLTGQLPSENLDFADVWSINATEKGVYFRTTNYLFFYDPASKNIKHWKPKKRFHSSVFIHGKLYILQRDIGLMSLEKGEFHLVKGGELFANEMIYAMLPFPEISHEPGITKKILIGTRNNGFFVFDGNSITPFKTEADSLIVKSQLYHGTLLPDGCFALATLYSGIVVINASGEIKTIIDQSSGLQNQCVRHVSVDRQGGLWIGLDDGIARVEISSPFTYFSEQNGLKGKIYSLIRHQGKLFAGTSLGVYYLDAKPDDSKPGILRNKFIALPGIASMCWSLTSSGTSLFVATTGEGVYQVQSGTAKLVSTRITFSLHRSIRDSSLIYMGLKDGVAVLRNINGRWTDDGKINGIDEEIRSIAENKDGQLWLGAYYKGLLRAIPRTEPSGQIISWNVERFGTDHGLPPGGIYIASVGNRNIFTGRHGLFRFDEAARRFLPDSAFPDLITDSAVTIGFVREDRKGNLWISVKRKDTYGFYSACPQKDGSFIPDKNLFMRFFDFSVTTAFPEENGIVWFGGPDGLIRYHSGINRNIMQDYPAIIRRVTAGRDSLLYGGSYPFQDAGFIQQPREYVIPYKINDIRFEFSASSFDRENENCFQYFLQGHDESWSVWNKENRRDYTNLSEGEYRFLVRAKNIYGIISEETVFRFRILPPFYRTWWAYTAYGFLFFLSVWGIVYWRSQRLIREKKILESLVDERTADLALRTEELAQKEKQLEKIELIVRVINTRIRLNDFLNALLNEIGFIEKIHNAGVLMYYPHKSIYRFACTRGWNIDQLSLIELLPEETENRYAPENRKVADDIYLITDPGSDSTGEKFSHLVSSQSMLVLKITIKGQNAGYIIFDRMKDEEPFTDSDIQLLSNLRQHILSGFMKAQLLTHLEEANMELQKLNDKKSEFLGFAAHDLRSPLGAIIGFIELLVQDLKENRFNHEEAVADLEMVLNSARQMVRLISELLDISAIESGKVTLEIQRQNMNAIFDECERIHRKHANLKNIRLIIEKNEKLPALLIDKSRIAEVVDNLLSNAIKYTYPDGEVRLFTEINSEEVRVHVRDSGQGLSDSDLKQIFVNFKKLSARPTAGESSTGFGLAIVKKIVELHHGRVWVESQVNKGSTFSFSIPLPMQ